MPNRRRKAAKSASRISGLVWRSRDGCHHGADSVGGSPLTTSRYGWSAGCASTRGRIHAYSPGSTSRGRPETPPSGIPPVGVVHVARRDRIVGCLPLLLGGVGRQRVVRVPADAPVDRRLHVV